MVGFASCNTDAPTFSWLQDSFSPHGVPHLQVDFHDGQPADVVNLKKFNPFVRQAEETVSILIKKNFAYLIWKLVRFIYEKKMEINKSS